MPLWKPLSIRGDQKRSSSGRLLLILTVLFALLSLVGVGTFQFLRLTPTHATATNTPVSFPTAHPAILKQSHVNGLANMQQRLSLTIGLRVPNQAALTRYVEDISHPDSVNYHRYLTPAQYEGAFSPTKAMYSSVEQYLQTAGFTITHTYTHRLLIAFSGTVAQVQRTFGVTIQNYTAPSGYHYYANVADPQLPAWFANAVQSFTGLNDAVRFQHPPLHKAAVDKAHPASLQPACLANDTTGSYLSPTQMATAYGLSDLYNAGYHGEGQTIALFELATFSMSDITAYTSCYGHSHTPIQTVVTGSSAVVSDGGMQEVELDAQVVLSAAPQLGKLVIYEAGNNSADYLTEWAQIVQDAVPVVSTSWGTCELDIDPSEAQQENILFMAAVAQGQSILAASGDSGSAGCAFDQSGNGTSPSLALSAGDPGAQPFVTSVGGTTLTVNNTAAHTGETTWNNLPDATRQYTGGASGGGISKYWAAPVWQSAPGVRNSSTSAIPCSAPSGGFCRETPDVSLNADPTSNSYLTYCTPTQAGCDAARPWSTVGGTSAAAPMWAALVALANQMSLKQGGFNLGFVNPLLYQIASDSAKYAASFHDIIAGNNDYNSNNHALYPATNNYDMATGLGSYKAFTLATNLVAQARNANPTRTAPGNTTWYFAEGSVGGGFQEFITLQNPSATQDAAVAITYLFEGRQSVVVTHNIPKSSRATVSVNSDLHVQTTDAQQALSAIVRVINNGPGIVAERPMYFSYKGIASGTDVVGATAPQSTYYFPSVDTRNNGRTYLTYLTMLNPSTTLTTHVTVTYYTGMCGNMSEAACPTQNVAIAPLHRGTATPLTLNLFQQTSVSVQSDSPIVVERPTYFSDTIATAGGATTGAASVVGAATPGRDWLFAEGYTGNNFQEYLVLANFTTTATSATVTLEYDNGHRQAISVSVPALGHTYFDVNRANTSPTGTCDITPCQTSMASSVEVTSAANIVVDRMMYFHYGSTRISGATETVGEAGPASHSVYAFAEGYTAGSFQEYLTLQNPTSHDETAAITLFVDTYVLQEQVTVKAQSRKTVGINSLVTPIAQAYNNMGSNSYAVSLTVQALGVNARIVAERPMYFNFYGSMGGTDVLGYTQGVS